MSPPHCSRYDLVLGAPGLSGPILVETKNYSSQSRVSIDHVYRLAEAVQLSGATAGLLISSADFATSASELAQRSGASLLSLDQVLQIRGRDK